MSFLFVSVIVNVYEKYFRSVLINYSLSLQTIQANITIFLAQQNWSNPQRFTNNWVIISLVILVKNSWTNPIKHSCFMFTYMRCQRVQVQEWLLYSINTQNDHLLTCTFVYVAIVIQYTTITNKWHVMTHKYTGNIEYSIITDINTWTFPVKGEVCYFSNNRVTKQNYKTNNCFQKNFLNFFHWWSCLSLVDR